MSWLGLSPWLCISTHWPPVHGGPCVCFMSALLGGRGGECYGSRLLGMPDPPMRHVGLQLFRTSHTQHLSTSQTCSVQYKHSIFCSLSLTLSIIRRLLSPNIISLQKLILSSEPAVPPLIDGPQTPSAPPPLHFSYSSTFNTCFNTCPPITYPRGLTS